MLKQGIFKVRLEDDGLNGYGKKLGGNELQFGNDTFGISVISAMIKRTRWANREAVSVRSRLVGGSKSNIIGT